MEGQMTDEQINERITEVTGLWDHPYSSDTRRMMDFCNDLNAMHEAERTLTGLNRHAFCDMLLDTVADSPDHLWEVLTATARQRAEAFLRTLGKREEAK
jgi:hypothetical protein